MKLSFLFFFLFLFLFIPSALAEPSYTFKQHDPVDLKIYCFDINNSICNTASTCQLTINYPNLTNLVRNGSMSFDGEYFNYSLTGSQTGTSGVYSVTTKCQGTTDGFSTFTYEVTPTGKQNDSILNNNVLIIIGLLSFALLILGFYSGNAMFGFFSGLMFLILGVYTMIYGFNDVTNLYTRAVAGVVIALGTIFTLGSAWEWTRNT